MNTVSFRRVLLAAVLAPLIATATASGQPAAEAIDGWIYLGRWSDGAWKPASGAVTPPPQPSKAGETLRVRADALFYSSVECRRVAAADVRIGDGPPQRWTVKPGEAPLDVIGPSHACDSAGGALTVWANVRVPAERLVDAAR